MTAIPPQTSADREVLAYFGHHKCASTWISGIVCRIMDEIGLRYYGVHDILTPSAVGPLAAPPRSTVRFARTDLRRHVDAYSAQFVICHTADRMQAEILRPTRAFHVIRDPRDLIVSAYFSHRDSHPTDFWPHLQAHREALQAIPLEQGLLLEMEFSKVELMQIDDWDYADESILELRMEDLVLHPYDGFLQIFRHLGLLRGDEPTAATEQIRVWMSRLLNRISTRRGLGRVKHTIPATGEIVLGAAYAQRFEAQTMGRERGVEDRSKLYRKGISGDWVNHFTPQHAEAFQAYFGDLLVRLGYEEDSDWIASARRPA
jgi:hypothetical protein